MRTILLSFKSDVFDRLSTGQKIYEHRKHLPNESTKAYLYISNPVKSIQGYMILQNRVSIESWIDKYQYDSKAVSRIQKYLNDSTYAMEISMFQNTNSINLAELRSIFPDFLVPRMYYYLDDTDLGKYLEQNLKPTSNPILHNFENINSNLICTH